MAAKLGLLKASDARRISAAEMKYMRRTAGYTWTDYKTNAQIAKEVFFFYIYLDKNKFSSQLCFIPSIAFLAQLPDCNNTKNGKKYMPLLLVKFIYFRNLVLKL